MVISLANLFVFLSIFGPSRLSVCFINYQLLRFYRQFVLALLVFENLKKSDRGEIKENSVRLTLHHSTELLSTPVSGSVSGNSRS